MKRYARVVSLSCFARVLCPRVLFFTCLVSCHMRATCQGLVGMAFLNTKSFVAHGSSGDKV